tara:strand:+ start:293 stop:637 length:345 start_codon:yes stop_codon:yes gene_type:complete
MDLIKFISGCSLLFLGQIGVWFQIYAPIKIDSLKNNWFIYGIAIPISFVFLHGIRMVTESFGGSMWPSRFLTFTLGMFSFAFLTWFFNGEGINLKNGICLVLAFIIICVQIFWK